MCSIIVTGTPGTGKTRVAEALGKKLKLPVLHVNELIKEKELYSGIENGSLIVNLGLLVKELANFKGIAEGHILCEVKLNADWVFVLRTSPPELRKRLFYKGFRKEKLKENVEAEMLDYCSIRARQNYRKVFDIDTTSRTVDETVQKIVEVMRGGKGDKVDWTSYLMKDLGFP